MKKMEKFLLEKGFTVTSFGQYLSAKQKTVDIDYYITVYKKCGMYQLEISEITDTVGRTKKSQITTAKECLEKLKKSIAC